MDAKNLMDEVTSRFSGLSETYKQGEKLATRAADRARDLYNQVEEQLPEGSMQYVLYGLAGASIAAIFYQFGKSRMRSNLLLASKQRTSQVAKQARQSVNQNLNAAKDATKDITRDVAQSVEKFDFTPVYRLAKLWLVYKISL
jgi:DNA-binding ferritin-like protein